MPIDYDGLKTLARQIGRPVKDLLALTPGNDPFYAGVPYRRREGEWFSTLWDRFQFPDGVHLRRIHYVLVSMSESGEEVLRPDGEPCGRVEPAAIVYIRTWQEIKPEGEDPPETASESRRRPQPPWPSDPTARRRSPRHTSEVSRVTRSTGSRRRRRNISL